MKLLIDIGNTSSKLAVTDGERFIHSERLTGSWADALHRLHTDYAIERIVVSCVGRAGEELHTTLEAHAASFAPARWLSWDTPCDISDIPPGYGADRLAADLGAYHGQHALLVIDAGTCITYDLIVDGRLTGGVISPGMQLRLNAMHDYTAALPQLSLAESRPFPPNPSPALPLFAGNTRECMLSAAHYGTLFEAEGYIRALLSEYPDLCVITTGGNTLNISKQLPHTHDPLLVLRGLNKL